MTRFLHKKHQTKYNTFSESFCHKYSLQIIIYVFKAQQQFEFEQSKTVTIL